MCCCILVAWVHSSHTCSWQWSPICGRGSGSFWSQQRSTEQCKHTLTISPSYIYTISHFTHNAVYQLITFMTYVKLKWYHVLLYSCTAFFMLFLSLLLFFLLFFLLLFLLVFFLLLSLLFYNSNVIIIITFIHGNE